MSAISAADFAGWKPAPLFFKTRSKNQSLLFQDLGSRKVVADFSGGTLSSDGGVLLLRQMDQGLGLSRALANCFEDRRDLRYADHTVQELVAQRLYGLALGYEDLNDHDRLRLDPLLAVACNKRDPLGMDRLHQKGIALAGASTLNRLELSNNKTSRYHKVSHDPQTIQDCLLQMGVRCLPKHATEWVSTPYLASNQLRLWFAALAYLLLERARTIGLRGTELARATVGSVRLKLLKVAAQVTVSVRRVHVQLSSAYLRRELFALCHRRLMALSPASG